jgi:adenosylcobinamide-GDP ribazoletransferase
MNSILLAISFLTILPAYGNRVAGEKELKNSLYFYPVVGMIIGAILASVVYLTNLIPLGIAGDALIVVIWIVLTGGLHLDGLMDTADGLFSGKDKEQKLQIMKDSRVGAMGVIALGVLLLLKLSFLASLTYEYKIWVVFLAPVLGRCLMVFSIVYFPYARKGPGLGKCFGENVGYAKVAGTAALLLITAYLAASITAVLLAATACILAVLVAFGIGRALGGQTGDTYGCLCEVSETLFLIVALIGLAGYYGI